MHVALDARYLNGPDSGVGTYVDNLVREALALDPALRFTLVTRAPGLAARFDADRCMDLVFDAPPRSYRTRYTLRWALRGHRFDLFHAPFNLLPRGVPRPAVVTIHDALPLQDPRLTDPTLAYRLGAGRVWRREVLHALRAADRVLTVSEASKDALLEHAVDLPSAQIAVSPLGADPYFLATPAPDELAAADALVGPRTPFVLLIGQGSPRKNHRRAVEAFLQAFGPDDPMRLVLVRRMTRSDTELQALLATPEAARRVLQLGYADRATLRALYHRARVFFFPSLVEGFGLPLIEAMAAGCVAVASDRSAVAEVAGEAALLASPFDVPAMAEALRRAHRDDALRARLAERGHARVQTFTWRRCAEATLAVYRDVQRSSR